MVDKLVQLLARLDPDQVLHLAQPELAQRLDALDLVHDVPVVLGRYTRYRAQHFLRSEVDSRRASDATTEAARRSGTGRDASTAGQRVLFDADEQRLVRVGLVAVFLQVAEDLYRLVRRRRPDDAQARERDRQQDEFGTQVRLGRRLACARCSQLGVCLTYSFNDSSASKSRG